MFLSFIVAVDKKGAMGCNNSLLCHLPDDLKFFKQITIGKTVIMGRKTFESIGKPLPNRRNIILTRQPNYTAEGCVVIHSIPECISFLEENEMKESEIFVIGGGSIFDQTFINCDKILITIINNSFENADTFFPKFKELDENNKDSIWNKKKKIMSHSADEKHSYSFDTFKIVRDKRKSTKHASPINQLEIL